MRSTPRRLALGAAIGLGLAGPAVAATPKVQIRHAAARVVVIPEARSDVKVEILSARRGLPLFVRHGRGRTVVDGRLGNLLGACAMRGARRTVRVRGVGEFAVEDLPQIAVRTPLDVRVEADGAVFGSVGRSARLELSNAGCGDWTAGNVQGQLKVNLTGQGDVHAGQAAALAARLAGAGDVAAGQIAGPATIDIVGAGGVTVAQVAGPLKINIAGSGVARVDAGSAPIMAANLTGSGEARFGGTAGDVDARVVGSGLVWVRRMTGHLKSTVLGSGRVLTGGR